MNEELMELGRRVVACKGWRWMPRMVDTDGNTYLGGDRWVLDGRVVEVLHPRHDAIPDLSDPATVGCLLALVRSVYRGMVHIQWTAIGFCVDTGHHAFDQARYPTFAAALVAALDAAP